MKRNMKIVLLVLALSLAVVAAGCTQIQSQFKDFKAETLGLAREFDVYDDFGNKTMTVSGNNTDMQPSDVENVLYITIDGHVWQHVGSSMIAAEKGIENIVDTYEMKTDVKSESGGTLTSLDRSINNFKAGFSGLDRVIIVKNQMGVIVGVYEGNKVFVEESSLPNTTKILIDGKRLHIYRCDFEIFEEELLN